MIILKYTIAYANNLQTAIYMPRIAKILSVAEVEGMITAYAQIDSDNPYMEPTSPRTFHIFRTDSPSHFLIPLRFIGSVSSSGAMYHVYEQLELSV